MRAVAKKSAEAQATSILRDHLLNGGLPLGARLTEMELSARLRIARATVRLALHRLAQEGLVIQIPYTGWMVANMTSADAWELYTLRAPLEALAARLAASGASEIGRKKLQLAMMRLTQACASDSLPDAAKADFALHETIVEISGHRRLAEQYRIVGQQIRMFIVSSDALLASEQALADQHQPIVDAILAGNGDLAASLSERHNISEGQKLVAYLSSRPSAESASPQKTKR